MNQTQKEENKNLIIQSLTEENEKLRELIKTLQEEIDGLKAWQDENVATLPLQLNEAIKNAQAIQEKYEQAYQEVILLKQTIEQEYAQKFEEALQQIQNR